MRSGEIEQFDNARGIERNVAANAGLLWTLRVTEVDDGDGELIRGQVLRVKKLECLRRGAIDDVLQ
jgi:hypothetical protein